MDEKQLQFLYNEYAKNKGFKDYSEFKGLMSLEGSRKLFFDDANKELGFKDYNEFNDLLGLKKKVGGEVSSPTKSQLVLPDFEKGKAFAEKGFLMQPEGTKAPKKQKISIEPSLSLLGVPKVEVLEEGEDPSLLASFTSAGIKGQIQGKVANILSAGRKPAPEELGEIAQLQSDINLFPQSKAERTFQEKGLAGLFKESPALGLEFIAETIVSSASALVESSKKTVPAGVVMGAAAGAPFAGIGALPGALTGIAAGQVAAGYNLSTSSKILEVLSKEGVDITNKESLINAFSDDQKMSKIRTTAAKYGVPIAIVDAVTGGIAGKLAAGAVGKSLAKRLAAGFGEAGIQVTGGASGDLAGQLASGQKVNWDDVMIEGIAAVPGGVTEVVSGVSMERAKASSNNKTLATQIATQGVEDGSKDAVINLNRDLANNVITPEQHQEGIVFTEKAAQVADKIPETVTGESRVKSIELLVERNDIDQANQNLLQQKQTTDVAYHAGIDEEIKANEERIKKLDAEVYNIAKKPSKEFGTKRYEVDGEEVSKEAFEALTGKPLGTKKVIKPTQEQQFKDTLEGNLVTFTYKSESEVPDVFKDKIINRGENKIGLFGKKEPFVRVTVPQSLADYELAKTEPTEVKVTEEVKPTEGEIDINKRNKEYPSTGLLVKKFVEKGDNQLLTGEDAAFQDNSIERTISSGIKKGLTADEIRMMLNANGHVFNSGNDAITINNYIKNRINGTETRPFGEFKKNTRVEAAEVKPTEVSKQTEVVESGNDLILNHGTKHDFDKFQLEKIGTGEGAQAFGYGLYFTDGSKIAEGYAKKLSEDNTGLVYSVKIKNGKLANWAEWRRPLDEDIESGFYNKLTDTEKKQYQDYVDNQFNLGEDKSYTGAFGDLELSEEGFLEYPTFEKPSAAGNLYQDLKDAFGQEKATEIFKRAGIDGIKYESKGGFGKENNYVVFNPESIEVIRKTKGGAEVKPTEVKSVEERKQLLNQLENTFNLKDRVKGLIDNGIIDNSYSIDMGRPIVIANIGGIKVPFYRSLSGTGGKTVDKWYPFFGFGKNSAKDIDLDWFVKGTLDQNEKNYNSPAIAEYSKILNSVLNYPRSLDRSVKGNPFVDIGAKPIGEVNKIIYGNKDSGIVNDGKGGGQVAIKSFIDKVNKAYEAEVKPTEVKVTEEVKPKEDNTLTSNKFTLVLSSEEDSLFKEYIERVGPDLVDANDVVKLANKIANVDGSVKRKLNHFSEALMYQDALIDSKDNKWFGKINSSDIIDIIKNPKKEFANLDRLDDIGLLSNDTKKQIEKVKEVGVKLASLDDNSKKLLAEFHKRMLINKPISEQIDSLNRILDYVGSEIKVNTKTEKSKKSDNNQYIRLSEAISKEVTEEGVASAEKTEPKTTTKESVEPPKPPKTPPPTQEPSESKEPFKADEKSILKRLSESKNISEDVKNKFKENLKYKVSSQEEAKLIAKEILKEYGSEDAVILAESGKFDGDVNSFIFAEAINNAVENELKATTEEDKIKYAYEWADYAMRYDESARKQGRFISAISDFYKKSPLGVIMVENIRRKEGFKAWFTNKEKSYKEVFTELTQDPEFKQLLDEKVQSELKEERKKSRADKRQKIEDFFENAKLKGNNLYAIPIPPQVINGALDVMKKAVLAGESITNAVSMAVEHISKEIKDWDKEKFRKEYEEKLNGIEGNKKSPLAEKSIKEKQEQLLDRFRKKLKGLNDDQKEDVIRRSFKKLIENGALEYDDFKKIIQDVMGNGELTQEEQDKIKTLVTKINAVEDVAKSIMEDGNRSAENLKKYQAVKKEAEKASTELGKMVFNKIDLTNSVLSKMQLRTLGLVSLIQNPIYNVMNQVFVRFPIGVQLTVLDQILYGGSKVSNKLFGTSVLYPENNIFASQKQFFTKGYQGGKLATEQFFTGLTNADYMQKDVKTSQIHPYTSAKDLWAWKFKGKPLTRKQVLDKLLQASIGIVAEITARGLNIGDKPQRFASEGAKAAVLAKYLGLKDVDFLYFMQFPKEESYRAFKKQGLSDAAAMQKAEEIEKSIIKEGQESTFQQDNIVLNIINAGIQKGGKPADVVKYFALPFFKTNSNVAWSLYNLAFPPVAFLQSAIYSARAISSKSKSDIQESKKWFAHGVTGIALFSVVGALVKAGIVNAENDDEITKKERVGEKSFEQQNSVNITKLNAYLRGENPNDVKDGLNIDLKWFGVTGMVANMVAKRIKRMTNQEKENQASYMEELLANQSDAAKELIQNGVFSTSADILQSIQGGGNFGNAVAFNLINMGTNIVQSATFAQISRAQLPYYSQQKADSFYDELKNNFLTRSSKLREITGKYPPSQNNIWGERMDRKDNTLMKLFGMSTTNKDNFAQPIYEDYKRTGNTKFFPPSIKPEVNNKKINNEQLNKLEVFVGKKRKMLAAPYINDGAILEGFPKVYSKLSDDDKLDALNKIYKVAYDLGVDEFVSLYPEYYQSKKQTPEQKKESSQSTKAGVALKNLAKNSKK